MGASVVVAYSVHCSRLFSNSDWTLVTRHTAWQAPCHQTGDNGKRDVSIKSWNFKDTRQKISVPLAMSTNLRKKSFKLFKKKTKNNSWADLGPRSA